MNPATLPALVAWLALMLPGTGDDALPPAVTDANAGNHVYAGVYLHDVTKFDQKDGVFDADFELWVKWLGDFDPAKLVLANASEVDRELIGEESDGTWHAARWRVRGTMRGEFPVHRFPFDRQTLSVVLEMPARYGKLVPDLAGSGMRERFSVTGWLYEPVFVPLTSHEIYRSDLGSIAAEGTPTEVERVAFEVILHRPLVTAATKLFLPLLVILLVAFVALFVHPKELEVRASVGVTSLLACFAFHFAVADSMPNVSYITLAESLFLISYGLCAALLFVSVGAKSLHENGHAWVHRRLDRVALVVFPLIVAGSTLVAARIIPESRFLPDGPVELPGPEWHREVSDRHTLRIGVSRLPRPTGLFVGIATNRGTIHSVPGRPPFPFLAREIPAITNDALEFRADGSLSVTWRLLPGLMWSNGELLSAADLKFALDSSSDPRIKASKVVSPEELVVLYKDRVAAATGDIMPLPGHAMPLAEGTSFDQIRQFRDENIMPSTGPFRVTGFVKDERLTLEANPHFAAPQPCIARIELIRHPSEAALIAAFEAGELDMITPNEISPESARTLATRRPDAVNVDPSDVLLFLHPDLSHPLLARREVRRALLKAFDRVRLRDDLFREHAASAPVAHLPVPGPMPEGAVETTFNPDAARADLERLGATGARIPVTHGPSNFDREVVAHLVQDAAAAGLTLEPREVPDINFVYRDPRHGGLLLIWRTGLREDEPEKYWNIPRSGRIYDRTYRSDAFDDTIASLVEREERALYPERREQIRDDLFAEFTQRLPLIPLLFLAQRTVVDPRLKGWEVGNGRTFATNLEQWYFTPPDPPE